jgi:hypothetical protein
MNPHPETANISRMTTGKQVKRIGAVMNGLLEEASIKKSGWQTSAAVPIAIQPMRMLDNQSESRT